MLATKECNIKLSSFLILNQLNFISSDGSCKNLADILACVSLSIELVTQFFSNCEKVRMKFNSSFDL